VILMIVSIQNNEVFGGGNDVIKDLGSNDSLNGIYGERFQICKCLHSMKIKGGFLELLSMFVVHRHST
jgi:regulator of replication initiation timing